MTALFRSSLPSLSLLLLAGPAFAQTAPAPQPAPVAKPAAQPAVPESPLPTFGLMVDLGAPDGLGAAGVVRPLDWLRLNAGLVTNTVGFGLRGGVSIAPFRTFVTPTLGVDIGHYFKADYSKLPERFGAEPGSAEATLKDVGYTFGSAHLGVELGSQRGFSFFLRAGLSYWDFSPANAEQALRDAADDPTLTVAPVSLRFTSPSFKLGFTYFF